MTPEDEKLRDELTAMFLSTGGGRKLVIGVNPMASVVRRFGQAWADEYCQLGELLPVAPKVEIHMTDQPRIPDDPWRGFGKRRTRKPR